jgi:signal transduction histidine kinase/ligand-binding sensor domain-containing protein/DNA-binding response OmpR family regulator
MKDGLSDESITSLVQDSIGFLWLGTHSGLNRFDGYRFTSYLNDPASTNSLANNAINALCLDNLGRLWIGHDEGLDIFDPQTESFLFHWFGDSNRKHGSTIKVRNIQNRKDGKVWICTNLGIYSADPAALRIEKFSGLPDLNYASLTEAADGSIWFATETGLIHFVPNTGSITMFVNDPKNAKSLSHNIVRNVFFDKQNRMWVGTKRGLNLFDAVNQDFTVYLPRLDVLNFFEFPGRKLWVATEYGVEEFDPDTGDAHWITGGYFTWAIKEDRQGVIWLPTLHGLHQINPIRKQFKTYSHLNNNIGYIVEDPDRHIWMSTFTGLYRFDQEMSNVYQHRKVNPDLSNLVGGIFVDSKECIWFASSEKIEKLDLNRGTSDSILISLSPNPSALLVDSEENIWLGTYSGIFKYDLKSKTYGAAESLPNTIYHFILEDSQQNIWMGTSVGLLRYNLKNKKFDTFRNDPANPRSLSNNIVYHILQDENKTLWVATDGGLNKMIPGTENTIPEFHQWRTSNSNLASNNVYWILDGKDGTFWMIDGNAVSHFFPERNFFQNYVNREGLPGNFAQQRNLREPINDGLPGRDMKEGVFFGRGLRSSSGRIYFGTGQGVVIFHPDSLYENPFIPPVVLNAYSINNTSVPVQGSIADTLTWKSPLTYNISYAKEILLGHNQNDFTLEFVSLNFVRSENNQYKYKLEPFEKEWIEATAENRVARYTNISPGKYTFRVIGSNNDGVWNEAGAKLTIIISPPWWQTWWAYSLYALAIATLIIFWRNYEIKRLRLKHQADHLRELDNLKTRFFTNISHEFRTPITLIQGPLKEMYDKALNKEERSTVGIMLRNAQRLSKLINQLLDLSKLEAGKMTLHASKVELVQFLREIASSYESLAANKNIKYFFYPEVAELMVYIDVEKIEKVVHNLLSNAFKFTKESGEVILYLKAEESQCNIIVKDTGIGIPSDQLNKVFDRFHQVDSSQTRSYEGSGLGMALAKELVELHHGTIRVESTEGKGTTFTVTLRLGKDHLNIHEIIEGADRRKSDTSIEETFMSPEQRTDAKTVESLEQPILLIVEDNADMRQYIRKTFSDHYQILEAANGKEGLDKSKEVIPDLIISDVMMPEMDGYKFCESIKTNEQTSHIPVILLTAKADRDSRIAGLETGADDYLAKPFDAEELKVIVRKRIEERRKIRERFSKEITLEPKQIAITSFDEKFLKKVMAVVEDHMSDESFSIDDLSREAGYSNMHFYRKIKALAGETPSQFLRTIRLKRAAKLLRAKSDNVTQIAYSVGFNSLSYFNKCFKEQFGVTPGQYAEGNKPNVKA